MTGIITGTEGAPSAAAPYMVLRGPYFGRGWSRGTASFLPRTFHLWGTYALIWYMTIFPLVYIFYLFIYCTRIIGKREKNSTGLQARA